MLLSYVCTFNHHTVPLIFYVSKSVEQKQCTYLAKALVCEPTFPPLIRYCVDLCSLFIVLVDIQLEICMSFLLVFFFPYLLNPQK